MMNRPKASQSGHHLKGIERLKELRVALTLAHNKALGKSSNFNDRTLSRAYPVIERFGS